MRLVLLVLFAASSASAQITPPPLLPASADGPRLAVTMGQDTYALANPNAAAQGLWVKVVVRGSTELDRCSAVVERRGRGGAWVPADTLGCEGAPPPRPAAADTTVSASLFHLSASVLQSLVARAGPGEHRVVYQAIDGRGRTLPLSERASPAFDVITFGSAHPDVVERVRALDGWRALAVARQDDQSYAWGYAYDGRTASAAANRALRECRGRAGASPCWVEQIMPPAAE